jgi:hypothetical protein
MSRGIKVEPPKTQISIRVTDATQIKWFRLSKVYGDTHSEAFRRLVDAGDRALLARLTPDERRRYLSGDFDHDDWRAMYARGVLGKPATNGHAMNGHTPHAEVLATQVRRQGPPPGQAGVPVDGPALMSTDELRAYAMAAEVGDTDNSSEADSERAVFGAIDDNDAA